jgi:hypothetical protein
MWGWMEAESFLSTPFFWFHFSLQRARRERASPSPFPSLSQPLAIHTLAFSFGVAHHQDDAVPADKEFGDEAVFHDGRAPRLLARRRVAGGLAVKLAHALQQQVAVPVKGLDPAQQLVVVAQVDQDLLLCFFFLVRGCGLRGSVAGGRQSAGGKQKLPPSHTHATAAPLQLTCVLLFTEDVSTDSGPVLNRASSRASSSSTVGGADICERRAASERARKKEKN